MVTSSRPSLRFFHSAALRTRSNKILGMIEQAKDPTQHAEALSNVVVDLTKAGLDYYYLKPLQQAKFGFVTRQAASFGMAGALRVMSPVIHTIVASTNGTQLRVIARHIRQLM